MVSVVILYLYVNMFIQHKRTQVLLYSNLVSINYQIIEGIRNEDEFLLNHTYQYFSLANSMTDPKVSNEGTQYINYMKMILGLYTVEELKDIELEERLIDFKLDYINTGYRLSVLSPPKLMSFLKLEFIPEIRYTAETIELLEYLERLAYQKIE